MFYDLNVPWSATDTHLVPRTLAFLHELGYNVVALNHRISGKLLPADASCPIPDPLPFNDLPAQLTVLRRCTLTLTDSHQNARLAALARHYDLLALRPIDERTLQLACTSLDCDIISLDLTQRLPFWLKHKQLSEAVKAGKKLEISYAQGATGDSAARRNLISHATQLIRASRGRGLILSSEAKAALACRGPWDVINLAAVWGLGQERGYEAMSKECRNAVVSAKVKRTAYRGVVDVVDGGEKPAPPAAGREREVTAKGKQAPNGQKRKADAMKAGPNGDAGDAGEAERPPSLGKKQMKRQKKVKLQALESAEQDASAGARRGTTHGEETEGNEETQNGPP